MKSTEESSALPEAPADGIPLAVKDLFDTAGVQRRTARRSSPSSADGDGRGSRVLEAAGYANVGKTNLHEFAYGVTSQNPHSARCRTRRSRGGSRGLERRLGRRGRGRPRGRGARHRHRRLDPDSGRVLRRSSASSRPRARPARRLLPARAELRPRRADARDGGELRRDDAAPSAGVEPRRGRGAGRVSGRRRVDRRRRAARPRPRRGSGARFPHAEPIAFPLPHGTNPLFMREVADVHRDALRGARATLYGDERRGRRSSAASGSPTRRRRGERRASRLPRAGRRRCSRDSTCCSTPTLAFVAPTRTIEGPTTPHRIPSAFTYPFNVSAGPRSRCRAARPSTACRRRCSSSAARGGRPRARGRRALSKTQDRRRLPKQAGERCFSPVPPPASHSPSGSLPAPRRRDASRRRHPRAQACARSSYARRAVARDTFSRTPSFAWQPVAGATATSSSSPAPARSASGALAGRRKTTRDTRRRRSPSRFRGSPARRTPCTRASVHSRRTARRRRGASLRLQHALDEPADAARARTGLIRWTPVDGATAYQVWYLDPDKIVQDADERRRRARVLHVPPGPVVDRHRALAHPCDPRAVRRRRERAARRLVRPVEPASTRRRTRRSRAARSTGPSETISDTISTAAAPAAHHVMPAFSFSGNTGLNGTRRALPRLRGDRSRLREHRLPRRRSSAARPTPRGGTGRSRSERHRPVRGSRTSSSRPAPRG